MYKEKASRVESKPKRIKGKGHLKIQGNENDSELDSESFNNVKDVKNESSEQIAWISNKKDDKNKNEKVQEKKSSESSRKDHRWGNL